MMKNLPKDYNKVIRELISIDGFIGLIDESVLNEDGALCGDIYLIFKNDDEIDVDKYFYLNHEFYRCNENHGFYESCSLNTLPERALWGDCEIIYKDELLVELMEV